MPTPFVHEQINFADYQVKDNEFAHLSLRDLLEARDLYHVHLMRHPNVVATAVGRYRIRKGDSWPNDPHKRKGTGVRRLDNSEIRPYSWPCILVFVDQWEDKKAFAEHPEDMVPKTLFTPQGGKVPVCVVEAPRETVSAREAPDVLYPLNNVGPGHPIIARIQGREFVATIACLVSDGHKVYALTNRHVTGSGGEVVFTDLGGVRKPIGTSAAKQLGLVPFSKLYPNFPGRDTFVNVDVGLIDLDDVTDWTSKIRDLGVMGPMADFSAGSISLSLIGCQVRGIGAAGGDMRGEIHALFYRYKASGGFEYVADLFIGPRSPREDRTKYEGDDAHFDTLPGDSGTLWLLEPIEPASARKPAANKKSAEKEECKLLPLAVQWGRHRLNSASEHPAQSFALATLISRVCAELEVDIIRDWNVDQTDTWGSIGHYSIANRAQFALSERFPKLVELVANNASLISHDDATILTSNFKGTGKQPFVAMADVPDFFWKAGIAKQGFARANEKPNHFADMDQPGPDGRTLLDLTKDDDFIDPDKWQVFYDSVTDALSGAPISLQHRGLLPFRVWQIFDDMVEFASDGDAARFICAAGVLTHYIGDACQPLHISFMHDGDPTRPVETVITKGAHAGETRLHALGEGVHSGYEDEMVNDNRKAILDALAKVPKTEESEWINSGFAAARETIRLMRRTVKTIAPRDLVDAYVAAGGKTNNKSAAVLWREFGPRTIKVMKDGTHLLGVLWESAWAAGNGEKHVKATALVDGMRIVRDDGFLPSMTIKDIGSILKHRPQSIRTAPATPAPIPALAEDTVR